MDKGRDKAIHGAREPALHRREQTSDPARRVSREQLERQSKIGVGAIGKQRRRIPARAMTSHDRRELRQPPSPSGGCLRGRVLTQIGHLPRKVVDAKSLAELDEQVPVQSPVQPLIEIPHGLECGAPEERRLLEDEIRDVDQLPEIERFGGTKGSYDVALLVDEEAVAVHHRAVAMPLEMVDGGADRPRQVRIVRVQPREDLAASESEPLVDTVGLPPVLRGGPAQAPFVAPENLERLVRGTSVHNEVFDPRVVLRENALDRLLDELPLVEGRRDDRDEGKIGQLAGIGHFALSSIRRSQRTTLPIRLLTA
jgi:hypothetical protein